MLASIQEVVEVAPIPNADLIERVRVLGWDVVCKKGEFAPGSLCIFIEIDTLLPRTQWSEFLFTHPEDTQFRLRSIKLRKQISQGLVLPLFPTLPDDDAYAVGDDVTDILKIKKYEKPLPNINPRSGMRAKGNFPMFIRKTDEVRIQSAPELLDQLRGKPYYITQKLDGCFLYRTYLPTWEGGSVLIGDIVSGKINRPVLIGEDENGKLCPSNIINVFNNGPKKEWMEILFDGQNLIQSGGKSKKIICTKNHKLLAESGYYKEAKNFTVNDKLYNYYTGVSDNLLHLAESALLGDGSLSTTGNNYYFSYSHKNAHKELVEEFSMTFSNTGKSLRNIMSGFGTKMCVFSTIQSYDFTVLRNKWYVNGKKIIPQDLSWFDDLSLAIWYMDDGNLINQLNEEKAISLSTNCFSEEDVNRLAKLLINKYRVDCRVYFSKGWCLTINNGNKSIKNIWERIAKYIPPIMRYKLPEKYWSVDFIGFGIGQKEYKKILVNIKQIKTIPFNKKNFPFGSIGFDIETDTGNYVSSGILVHNCSGTFFKYNGKLGVCSRNLELKDPTKNFNAWFDVVKDKLKAFLGLRKSRSATNPRTFAMDIYWKMAYKYRIMDWLPEGWAIQGEICGPSIQGNKMGLEDHQLFIFNVWNIDEQKYYNPMDWDAINGYGLDLVPLLYWGKSFGERYDDGGTIEELLKESDGEYDNGTPQEGIVVRANDQSVSFKIVNNVFLLKYKE